jgi:two-component system sensor histidine kinase GlrK
MQHDAFSGMRLYYPRSFLMLIFIGFLLVAVPLIIGLGNSAVSIDRLAAQSQRAVYQAAQVAHGSRVLADEITAMERSVGQYVILNDESLLDGYTQAHTKFRETAGSLGTLPIGAEQRQLLAQLLVREQATFEKVAANRGSPAALQDITGEFEPMLGWAQVISAQGNSLIEQEVDAMREMAGGARRVVIWQLLALVLVAAFLMIAFTILIVRPIRQIDAAIRRLGDGELSEEVSVEGPQDIKYLAERLDWMRRRLLEVDEQKTKFLQHISHELKTPLTALREGAELLSEGVIGKLSGEQQQVAEILRHNSVRLQRLIEHLLDYSALQRDKSSLQIDRLKVKQLVQRVMGDHLLVAMNKNVRLEADCPDIDIAADQEKLRIILDNLLSNALKFAPNGTAIGIRVRQDGDEAVFDVVDAGPGIPLDERDKVFGAFYRGSSPAASQVNGTGLGLAIAREYAQAHDGSVEVVEDTQQGAHFKVILPINQARGLA